VVDGGPFVQQNFTPTSTGRSWREKKTATCNFDNNDAINRDIYRKKKKKKSGAI